ncbi:MAG: transaldolase [Reyranella sp.]|jgi:transaldolase|nr:transaldolase [Reyranella sp.]
MSVTRQFKVKLFADGANLSEMLALYKNPLISGFTTNPTLMRKAGISDYAGFARQVVEAIPDRPVSFEVFADDIDGMLAQGRAIARWGKQVNVKIPVTNTKGEYTGPVLEALAHNGVALNVTAIMTVEQVKKVAHSLAGGTPSIVSVFAGRIADTGVDPVPHMIECRKVLRDVVPNAELLWASPRELLNVYHADEAGCDIITATPDILAKLSLGGKDLVGYSLETVQMFHRDATAAGFRIEI